MASGMRTASVRCSDIVTGNARIASTHVIEVYDAVTETKNKRDVGLKDDRLVPDRDRDRDRVALAHQGRALGRKCRRNHAIHEIVAKLFERTNLDLPHAKRGTQSLDL